jgi:hypothetical protein
MISPYSHSPGQTTNHVGLPRTFPPRDQRASPVNGAQPDGPGRKRARTAPSDRSPSRWQRVRSPLSTGCPGPFHAQPPVQPDQRLSVRLVSPVLDCAATYRRSSRCQPPILAMSTADPRDVNRDSGHRLGSSAAICRFCPVTELLCRAAAKICRRCPLACRGFGVWITPLGVTCSCPPLLPRPTPHSPSGGDANG